MDPTLLLHDAVDYSNNIANSFVSNEFLEDYITKSFLLPMTDTSEAITTDPTISTVATTTAIGIHDTLIY